MLVDLNPRIQSGVVPIKDGTHVMLVRSKNDKNWVFPKGGVEPGLNKRDSAEKEAYEEAGVTGHTHEKIGVYEYVKDRRLQIVHMFWMEVNEVLDHWPEQHHRTRILVTLEQAKSLVPKDLRWVLKAARKASQ